MRFHAKIVGDAASQAKKATVIQCEGKRKRFSGPSPPWIRIPADEGAGYASPKLLLPEERHHKARNEVRAGSTSSNQRISSNLGTQMEAKAASHTAHRLGYSIVLDPPGGISAVSLIGFVGPPMSSCPTSVNRSTTASAIGPSKEEGGDTAEACEASCSCHWLCELLEMSPDAKRSLQARRKEVEDDFVQGTCLRRP